MLVIFLYFMCQFAWFEHRGYQKNVILAHDLAHQGHMTLQSRFISRRLYGLNPWSFFCFLGFLGQESQWRNKWTRRIYGWPCTLQHVKVTWLYNWPFPILGTMRARTMIFFFVSQLFWVRNVNGVTNRPVEFTGDLVCDYDRTSQLYGHVTLSYKVKCECYASDCYFVDFSDPKNLRNKKKIMVPGIIVAEIAKVIFMVTWPWDTRSCMTDTLLNKTDLNFFIIQWWDFRKNQCDSIHRVWNSNGHINIAGGIESRHRSRSSEKVTTLIMFFSYWSMVRA